MTANGAADQYTVAELAAIRDALVARYAQPEASA
jgi:hypothetical protein